MTVGESKWKGPGKAYLIDWTPQRWDGDWPDYFLKARALVKEATRKEIRGQARSTHEEFRRQTSLPGAKLVQSVSAHSQTILEHA